MIEKLKVEEELVGGIYVLYATFVLNNEVFLHRNHSVRPMKHLINEKYLEDKYAKNKQ